MLTIGMVLAVPCARASAADDALSAARTLYVSAAYEEALAELDRLESSNPPAPEHRAIDQYRISCLLALGRTGDAERVIQAVVRADPWYFPSSDDVAPRVRSVFEGVRDRSLPDVIQQTYAHAKASFEAKDFAAAAAAFGDVLRLLADPAMKGPSGTPPLSDLKVLASGFRDLSITSSPPPLPATAPAMPDLSRTVAAVVPPKIYELDEPGIVAPVIIQQTIPAFREVVIGPMSAILEVVINEQGAVESALMRGHTTSLYDKAVLAGATGWKYQPATLNGVPVKCRKRVRVKVDVPASAVPR
jgi:hypothetical protein